jgi:hypothetical protein
MRLQIFSHEAILKFSNTSLGGKGARHWNGALSEVQKADGEAITINQQSAISIIIIVVPSLSPLCRISVQDPASSLCAGDCRRRPITVRACRDVQ